MFIVYSIDSLHRLIQYNFKLPPELMILHLSHLSNAIFMAINVLPLASDIGSVYSQIYLNLQRLEELGSTCDKKLICLQTKAWQPINVKIGSYFVLDRRTTFKTFGFVLYWTAKCFILFK